MGNAIFSARIKELRRQKGISMEELAKELNVTKSRVNMWENNGTLPRSAALLDLAHFYGVSTDYLIGNDHSDFQDPTNKRLNSLQRNLSKLNEKELEKAEGMLKAVFMDIFNDDEDDDDDI